MSTLSYALIGALSTKSRTGYELAQHMRTPIAYMWAAQHSQIYPELNRLADAGLIAGTVIPGRGPRNTKRYAITDSGRRAQLHRQHRGEPVTVLTAGEPARELDAGAVSARHPVRPSA